MSSKRMVFVRVAVAVFLLVTITATMVTFIAPEVYASAARVRVVRNPGETTPTDPQLIQAKMAVIGSPRILDEVVWLLRLNSKWAKKYGMQGKLKTAESRQILRHRLELRPVGNTGLVDIKIYSDDKNEAAEIANAIAATCRDYGIRRQTASAPTGIDVFEKAISGPNTGDNANATNSTDAVPQKDSAATSAHEAKNSDRTPSSLRPVLPEVPANLLSESEMTKQEAKSQTGMPMVEIIDLALPGKRPVQPNVPVNIFLGAIIGILSGVAIGRVAAFFAGKLLWKKEAG